MQLGRGSTPHIHSLSEVPLQTFQIKEQVKLFAANCTKRLVLGLIKYLAVNTIIMKYKSLLLLLLLFGNLFSASAERKMLHIYVALCDN